MARKNKAVATSIVPHSREEVVRYEDRPASGVATRARRSIALGLGVFVGVLVVSSLKKV
jgi:hypothetical protein